MKRNKIKKMYEFSVDLFEDLPIDVDQKMMNDNGFKKLTLDVIKQYDLFEVVPKNYNKLYYKILLNNSAFALFDRLGKTAALNLIFIEDNMLSQSLFWNDNKKIENAIKSLEFLTNVFFMARENNVNIENIMLGLEKLGNCDGWS